MPPVVLSAQPDALGLDFFLDAGSLASQVAQVIQLCASHIATAFDYYIVDLQAIGLENPFDTLAMGNLAHGECGVIATVTLGDDDTFIGLQTLARSFLYLHLDNNGVARREIWNGFFAHPLVFELLDNVCHGLFPFAIICYSIRF